MVWYNVEIVQTIICCFRILRKCCVCFYTWSLGASRWEWTTGTLSPPVGAGWALCPLLLLYSCHALAARKYWRVRIEPNPNISSAASVRSDQTPSICHLYLFFYFNFVGYAAANIRTFFYLSVFSLLFFIPIFIVLFISIFHYDLWYFSKLHLLTTATPHMLLHGWDLNVLGIANSDDPSILKKNGWFVSIFSQNVALGEHCF